MCEAKILNIVYWYQSISIKSCDFIPLANRLYHKYIPIFRLDIDIDIDSMDFRDKIPICIDSIVNRSSIAVA